MNKINITIDNKLYFWKFNQGRESINHQEGEKEVIRISLREEQIEFIKKNVTLGNVSVHKEKIEEIEHIEETLKKERAKLKISGSPQIIDQSR